MRTDLSREWASRPADERYLSLDDLIAATRTRADRSTERVASLRDLRFAGDEHGQLTMAGPDGPLTFSNWSFEQTCNVVGAPADYLTRLPAPLAALNLRTSAKLAGDREVMGYYDQPASQLRALTSAKYGRIPDYEVATRIKEMAETSDVRWKVPGCMDWSTHCYDPHAPVTLESTTLFASDRDIALFLCDDLDPIEVGKLAGGEPDLMFRGIFVRNSEVEASKFVVSTMYLRGVCANRCLTASRISRRSRSCTASMRPIGSGIRSCRPSTATIAATSGTWSRPSGSPRRRSRRSPATTPTIAPRRNSGFWSRPASSRRRWPRRSWPTTHRAPGEITSVWDVANQLTSFAQTMEHQDERLKIEQTAGRLLDRVTA